MVLRTMLLAIIPTRTAAACLQAVSDYMSAVELLHQTPQGNFWPGIESHMWSALLPYHELPR
jgi:hypothetical protein